MTDQGPTLPTPRWNGADDDSAIATPTLTLALKILALAVAVAMAPEVVISCAIICGALFLITSAARSET